LLAGQNDQFLFLDATILLFLLVFAQHLDKLRTPVREAHAPASVLVPLPGGREAFVSFIDEMDSSGDSVGIDVPESCEQRRSPSC
jgi:hypothetical protein